VRVRVGGNIGVPLSAQVDDSTPDTVHVVYGLVGLKTHTKIALVVRDEPEGIRRYVHIGTGNYNSATAKLYEDLGLFTSDDDIGADLTHLFNYLTGYGRNMRYEKLVTAPHTLRPRMTELIFNEINAEKERPGSGRIRVKVNSLVDPDMIEALYAASQAGVQIDLIVRGVCTLQPGVPGLSENIRVRSIVGRLLEHSRVYYFENGGEPIVFTGSADWMPRNLDRRVEVLAPVHDPDLRDHLTHDFLGAYLRDNVKARQLFDDGTYRRVGRGPGEEEFDSQSSFQHISNIIPFEANEH